MATTTTHSLLTIRTPQLAAFKPELERQFVQRVCDWLADQDRDGRMALSPEALTERVVSCVRRARRYGFASKREVSLFVALDWRLGFEFERMAEYAWTQALLTQTGLTPVTRLYRIECRLERLAQVAADHLKDGQDA